MNVGLGKTCLTVQFVSNPTVQQTITNMTATLNNINVYLFHSIYVQRPEIITEFDYVEQS